MKKAEEHFNKTISWYQKRGLLPNDWFEVGQPAFKRALKIAQQETKKECIGRLQDVILIGYYGNQSPTDIFKSLTTTLTRMAKKIENEEKKYCKEVKV